MQRRQDLSQEAEILVEGGGAREAQVEGAAQLVGNLLEGAALV